MLTVGGVISLLLGSMMLIRSESALEFIEISWSLILATVALTVLFFMFVIGLGLKAQTRKPTTGTEGLIGEIGEALTTLSPKGQVRVHGELWNAESTSGKIAKGEKVKVVAVDNLSLRVERTQ